MRFLTRLETGLAMFYFVLLPISMTAAWAVLVAGLVLWSVNETWLFSRTGKLERLWRWTFIRAPFSVPIGIFAACLTISGIINGHGEPAPTVMERLKEGWESLWSLKTILPYYWSFRTFSRNRHLIRPGVYAFLSVTAVAGVWGTIQQTFNIHPGYKYLQATGFLGGPMQFAGQMQLASLLALGLFAGRLNKFHPVFAVILLANLSGILFAGERSAWLGAASGAIFLAAMISAKVLISGVCVLAIVFALTYSFVPLVKTRVSTLFSGKDVSVTARMTIWSECARLAAQKPWFGVGIRNFPHFDIKEAIVPGVSKDLNHAHSNYIHILTTTGIAGLAAFLNLIYQPLRRALYEYRHGTDTFSRALGLGLAAGMVSLLVSGVFEFNFGTSQVRMAAWFLLGLL